jgi:hypothetical protein
MSKSRTEMRLSQITDPIWIVFSFALPGFLFGVCFHWITSLSSLTDFWFVRTEVFLWPTYKYHLAFSTTLLLGLIAGYMITQFRIPLRSRKPPVAIRIIAMVLVVLASAPSASFIAEAILGPFTLLLSVFLFLLIVSVAAWIFTGEWKWVGFAAVVLSPFIALAVTAIVSASFQLSYPAIDFLQWSIVGCLLSVSLGYWLMEGKVAEHQSNV